MALAAFALVLLASPQAAPAAAVADEQGAELSAQSPAIACFGSAEKCFAVPSNGSSGIVSGRTSDGRLVWLWPRLLRDAVRPFDACCTSCNKSRANSFLTCSNSAGEEQFVVSSLLPLLRPNIQHAATYLEIGGFDGIHSSNTLYLENCLNWRGVLIEGHPRSFQQLVANRPGVVALHSAICKRHGTVHFRDAATGSGVVDGTDSSGNASDGTNSDGTNNSSGQRLLVVPCAPLSHYLALASLEHLTFFSLDVEGAELASSSR